MDFETHHTYASHSHYKRFIINYVAMNHFFACKNTQRSLFFSADKRFDVIFALIVCHRTGFFLNLKPLSHIPITANKKAIKFRMNEREMIKCRVVVAACNMEISISFSKHMV